MSKSVVALPLDSQARRPDMSKRQGLRKWDVANARSDLTVLPMCEMAPGHQAVLWRGRLWRVCCERRIVRPIHRWGLATYAFYKSYDLHALRH